MLQWAEAETPPWDWPRSSSRGTQMGRTQAARGQVQRTGVVRDQLTSSLAGLRLIGSDGSELKEPRGKRGILLEDEEDFFGWL